LLSGFGVSTWLFLRERDARQEQARLRVVAEQARANEVRLREDADAVDLVAQAAVLLRYSDKEQADQLVNGMTAGRVPRTLESGKTFMSLANWNLSQRRWKAAAARFYQLAHVLVSVDMTDSERISQDLLPTLTAVCEWGEPGQYEKLRSLVINRFVNSANAVVAEQVIKATMLIPADKETLRQMLPLAGVIEASYAGSRRGQDPHMVAWRQFSLALIAFRQGQVEGAKKWANLSLATATNSPSRAVSNRIILAMVDHEEGRLKEARAALQDVRTEVEKWETEPFSITTSDGLLWSNWGIARILLNEAVAMPGQAADES